MHISLVIGVNILGVYKRISLVFKEARGVVPKGQPGGVPFDHMVVC